jgi:hypothetical protein
MTDRLTRWAMAGALASSLAAAPRAHAADPTISHDVFFTLKDGSPAEQDKLVAACQKYLSGHEGTIFFSVGRLVAEHQREVNDRAFQVSLHVVFKDKASHDKYQEHPRHKQFIAENSANWEKVRVFDSYVTVTK